MSFLLLRWIVFFGIVSGLVLNGTSSVLYYDLSMLSRIALMESIEPSTPMFLSLLDPDCAENLQLEYIQSQPNSNQALKLFQCYWEHWELHKVVFPLKLLCGNSNLFRLIQPRIAEYIPGVIKSSDDVLRALNGQDYSMIAENIGDNITLYGDLEIANFVECRRSRAIPGDSSSLFDPFPSLDLSNVENYKNSIKRLELDWSTCDEYRLAAFRTKLLTRFLQHPSPRAPQKLDALRDFLENVNVDHVPVFLIEGMVEILRVLGIFLEPEKAVKSLDSIFKIQRLMPTHPSIGGNLEAFVRPWKNHLHSTWNYQLEIPDERLTVTELLEWWGNYTHLGKVLVFKNKFHAPLVFENHSGKPVSCSDIVCLLCELSAILSVYKPLLEGFLARLWVPFESNEVDSFLFRAFARTFASNLLYRFEVGVPIDPNHIFLFYYPDNCGTKEAFNLFNLMTGTFLSKFIPRNILLSNTGHSNIVKTITSLAFFFLIFYFLL